MKKSILILPLIVGFSIISCNEKKEQKAEEGSVETEVVADPADSIEVVNTILKNKAGEELQLLVNNKDNQATVVFKGDSIKLDEKPAASGIWYSNAEYELRGKGEQVELTKDGQVIFSNQE